MAIEFSGDYRIAAPKQQVWEALNDPAVLQQCIAGCKSLERRGPDEFVAIVAARVGPVSATFRGSVVLSDLDPPNGYTLTGQGQGGAAGFAKMGARVALGDDGAGTLLAYTATAEIGGKLAAVGSRLMQSVAKKNADEFFAALAARFAGDGAGAGDSGVSLDASRHGASASDLAAAQIDPAALASAASTQISPRVPGEPPATATTGALAIQRAQAFAVVHTDGSLLGSLAAPVPAWLVVLAAGLGTALGYFIAR